MTIDTKNLDNASTVSILDIVKQVKDHQVVPIVRYVEAKRQWAIFGPNLLADGKGVPMTFATPGEAGDVLMESGVVVYMVDGRD